MKLSDDGQTLIKVNSDEIIDGVYQIPIGASVIGNWAFLNCVSLSTLMVPEGVTTIGKGAFYNCSNLHKVIIPAGVTTICNWTFSHCISLQQLTIPAGIRAIGSEALLNCNDLTWIIIDSDNEKEIARITRLLPDNLKGTVIAKHLYDKIISLIDTQLARLMLAPQTNRLYRFFNYDARFVSKVKVENEEGQAIEKECGKLPNDVFNYINKQLGNDNPYYQKVKTLLNREPWPKNKDGLKDYEIRLVSIVTECINKAWDFSAPRNNVNTYSYA